MAARKVRKDLDEAWREKIKTSQIINRLIENTMADEEVMTSGQIRSAEILLKKTIPDLSATDLTVQGRLTLKRKVKRLDGSIGDDEPW